MFQPYELPCGLVLRNRIVKAALSENLAEGESQVSDSLIRLCQQWGECSAGALILGGISIDERHVSSIGEPGLPEQLPPKFLRRLKELSTCARQNGSAILMQLTHPGALARHGGDWRPVSASADQLNTRKNTSSARAMTDKEIAALIDRFADVSEQVQAAGFDGVQLQAGHGDLISQFLSPRSNRRSDEWGGGFSNRVRLLMAVLKAVRERVSAGFAVGVKLSVTDAFENGWSFQECLELVDCLQSEDIDLIEIAGDVLSDTHSENRKPFRYPEVWLSDHARLVRARSRVPIMLTGGVAGISVGEGLIAEGYADLIGFGRLFCQPLSEIKSQLSNRAESMDVPVPEGMKRDPRLYKPYSERIRRLGAPD